MPTLHGYIHFNGVSGRLARVHAVFYDPEGAVVETVNSEEKTAFTNGHAKREIEVEGPAGAVEAKITLQTKADNGVWGKVGPEQWVEYGPLLATSDILIDRPSFNFGGGTLTDGVPSTPAHLYWYTAGH